MLAIKCETKLKSRKSNIILCHSAAGVNIIQSLSNAMARSASNSVNPSNGLVKMK